ncbi:hypothetical protein ABFB09_08805 [Dehalogenimonas sp. THU2]|uniref:hypothetical protein n=1 Tax=Dehalogenimonas sp. THU2 TaxID=3151121 RepID=UPI003218960B
MSQDNEVNVPRLRGGQPGNQNATTHGFYARHFTEQQCTDFAQAAGVRDLAAEIGALRVRLAAVDCDDPAGARLFVRACGTIGRLLAIQDKLGQEDRRGIRDAVLDVLRAEKDASIGVLENGVDG